MPIPHLRHSKSWRDKHSKPAKRRTSKRSTPTHSESSNAGSSPKGKKPNFKQLFKTSLPYLFIAGALGVLLILVLFAWYSRDLPRPDKIIDRSVAQSTKIYDKTGEHLLFEAFGTERRTIIPLEDIPEYVKMATILVEDKNFYTHNGFDIKGIIRAVFKNILAGRKAEGGSTLTQQLVKNAILTTEKAYSRKIKEVVLSYQIENKFSKDQILQLYYNEIPYGSNAYGIESASQFYFAKSAKDLSIAEGATIAALPKAPTYYSPYGSHVADLMGRKNLIIGLLEENNVITKDEAEEARAEELTFAERNNSLQAPHFVIWVREQLAEEYGEREVEQGGLRVITTLDWDMQHKAEAAVEEYAESNEENYDATNASLVAMDPKNGHIIAMVGSRDYFDTDNEGNFNVAVQGNRQPGSSFKPFVYAVGFEKGYTDKTTLWDVVTEFGEKADGEQYEPKNYDLEEHGPVSVREALAGSMNIPAVKMLYLVGARNVIKKAQALGYTTLTDPERYGLSLVLGGAEVTLLEHTNAYATLANRGVRHEPVAIIKVEDKNGKTLQEYEEEDGEKVFEEEIVDLLTDVLSDNNARSPYFGAVNNLTLGSRPVAGKTGTTNDYKDAWMMGYTPSLAAGVWVGNNDFGQSMRRGAGGSRVAAPIWNRFMRTALEDTDIEYFEEPNFEYPEKPILRGDLQEGTPVKIDRASGLLATELTPESFIEEKNYRIGHSILYYVKIPDPKGSIPEPHERDNQYDMWEKAVQRWIEEEEWESEEGEPPTEEDNLHVFENIPSVSILSPRDGETVSGDIITFRVEADAPRGVSRVEFLVDGEVVAESRSNPYVGRYIPNPNQPNGFHTMQAIAYDDIDNSASAEITFNLFLEKTNLSVSWSEPRNNVALDESDFPIAISLTLPSTDLQKVDVYYAPENNLSQYTLLQTFSGVSGTIRPRWTSPPDASGTYEIYAVLWDTENKPHRVDGITVEVTVDEE